MKLKTQNFKLALQPLFWVYAVMCRFFKYFNYLDTSGWNSFAVGGWIALVITGLFMLLFLALGFTPNP
jgi:hypothetical protein